MAKLTLSPYREKSKKKRPGVHSKCKTSRSKNSINYKKKIIDLLNPLITNYLKKESIQILLQKDKIIFMSQDKSLRK